MHYQVEVAGRIKHVNVQRVDGRFIVTVDGREHVVDARRVDANTMSLLIGKEKRADSVAVTFATDPATRQLVVGVGGATVPVSLNGRRRSGRKDETASGGGPQRIVAPMSGKIVKVLVNKGDAVRARQPLVVIEAMKMENELRAAGAGAVAELHVQEGQSVDAGTLVALVGPA
jgi:glutaconyl-CoA/methylmalonyl-CoA decarboxylase subunit gamma